MSNFPLLVSAFFLLSCSSSTSQDSKPSAEKPDSVCDSACDSSPLTYPVVTGDGGYGAVTTYGNVTNPEFSGGGACNYGFGKILNYAAVHVNVEPGDAAGLWDGGRHCGDCLRVRVGAKEGWKSIVVRVVDKCPDAYCGIDLGGNPAKELMGNQPGRYQGEWEWVDCAGAEGVSDGPPVLVTKEGTNAWWSLVQVRNGKSSVTSMSWADHRGVFQGEFKWATEAENFFKIPDTVLTIQDSIQVWISYRNGQKDTIWAIGTDFGKESKQFDLH